MVIRGADLWLVDNLQHLKFVFSKVEEKGESVCGRTSIH